VAGGLSQSAVNDQAGARTPLALIFASTTLALCLLFPTGLLENLPKAEAVGSSDICLLVCDLSQSPYIDLAGSRILHKLHSKLSAYGIGMRIVGAHGSVLDLLRADGIGDKVGGLDRITPLDSVLANGSSGG
jgi:MFS superfamily sulfate permease-like transporter